MKKIYLLPISLFLLTTGYADEAQQTSSEDSAQEEVVATDKNITYGDGQRYQKSNSEKPASEAKQKPKNQKPAKTTETQANK